MQEKTDKKHELTPDEQKLITRVRRIRGQVTAVEKNLTEDADCGDVLMQLAAIRGAVNSLMAELLEDHIRLHLEHPKQSQLGSQELTEHLIDLVKAYLK